MKLCVIGNSHLGMLAAAYLEARPRNLQLTFWGKPKLQVTDFCLTGMELCAEDPMLKTRLRSMHAPDNLKLSDFDAIVFVAMTASMFTAARLLSTHRIFGWPEAERSMRTNTGSGPFDYPLLTASALRSSLIAGIKDNVAYQVSEEIRQQSDLPIIFVEQPYPSERLLKIDGRHKTLKRVQEFGQGRLLAKALNRALQEATGDLAQVSFIGQPQRTVVHGFLTRDRFTREAVRFDPQIKQHEQDILHTNIAFGHIVLRRIRRKMDLLSAG